MPYLLPKWPKSAKNWYPIYDQHRRKTIPFGAAHTYIADIREYPPLEGAPGPGWSKPSYEKQKPSTCRATLFRCKFWVNISCFSPCLINSSRNKNICCRSKKLAAKSLLWATNFDFVACFSSNSQLVHTKQINQSVHCIFSTHNKCFCFCCGTSWSREVQNEKHRTKTRNKTMLRDKLRTFVSRILPP